MGRTRLPPYVLTASLGNIHSTISSFPSEAAATPSSYIMIFFNSKDRRFSMALTVVAMSSLHINAGELQWRLFGTT